MQFAVSTPLKNISQLGLLFPIYGKIKNVPNHQPEWEVPLWKGKNDYNWIQLADFPWPSQIPEPWLSQFLGHVASFFCCRSNSYTPGNPKNGIEWPCLAGIVFRSQFVGSCWFHVRFQGKTLVTSRSQGKLPTEMSPWKVLSDCSKSVREYQ